TYIRTLAADIAAGLGTIGYVRGLRRLSLDPFDDLPMYTLEQLTGLSPEARDALCYSPIGLSSTCRRSTWPTTRSRACCRGGRSRPGSGPRQGSSERTTTAAASSAWCRVRPTGGSGRCGCSWTSPRVERRRGLIPRFCLRLSAARVQCAARKTAHIASGRGSAEERADVIVDRPEGRDRPAVSSQHAGHGVAGSADRTALGTHQRARRTLHHPQARSRFASRVAEDGEPASQAPRLSQEHRTGALSGRGRAPRPAALIGSSRRSASRTEGSFSLPTLFRPVPLPL